MVVRDGTDNVWLYDVARATSEPLTFGTRERCDKIAFPDDEMTQPGGQKGARRPYVDCIFVSV